MSIHAVTGVGADGRSTVISIEEKAGNSSGGFEELADDSTIMSEQNQTDRSVIKLYHEENPAVYERPATGHFMPIATPPNGALWIEMNFDGSYETEFHRTDSIDFHCIISGEVELILEDGSVNLKAGDTVIVPGVIHRWRSEKSWRSNLFAIGLEPV